MPIAATPEILQAVPRCLLWRNIGDEIVEARNVLRSGTASPAILADLREARYRLVFGPIGTHVNHHAKAAISKAVGALGPAAATPEILATLAWLLDYNHTDSRSSQGMAADIIEA